ncbi:Protein MAIN-LIKE 2 [Linum perenne]
MFCHEGRASWDDCGLDVVWETGIRRVVVQTDYMVAMTLIKGTRAMCHQHAGEVSTIRMILQHDWEVTISHIYRKGIKVADYLAWIASGWRPETNTFHLVPGEATINLEDVEVLTGLPTMGRPLIVSPDERPVSEICEQWSGVQPPANAIQGRTVRVAWVKKLFDRLPDGATAEVITYHARTYTWVLLAGVLLADRNEDHIQVHLL